MTPVINLFSNSIFWRSKTLHCQKNMSVYQMTDLYDIFPMIRHSFPLSRVP